MSCSLPAKNEPEVDRSLQPKPRDRQVADHEPAQLKQRLEWRAGLDALRRAGRHPAQALSQTGNRHRERIVACSGWSPRRSAPLGCATVDRLPESSAIISNLVTLCACEDRGQCDGDLFALHCSEISDSVGALRSSACRRSKPCAFCLLDQRRCCSLQWRVSDDRNGVRSATVPGVAVEMRALVAFRLSGAWCSAGAKPAPPPAARHLGERPRPWLRLDGLPSTARGRRGWPPPRFDTAAPRRCRWPPAICATG